MKRTAVLAPIAALMLAFGAAPSSAQLITPYISEEGVPTAEQIAKDSLGNDARLVSLASVNAEFGGSSIGYDLESGTSAVWVYMFYSGATKKFMPVAVVQVPFLGFQGNGETQDVDTSTFIDTTTLDRTGTYGSSDKIFARLTTLPEFQQFRSRFPNRNPDYVALGNIALDSVEGSEVDPNQPIWTMAFAGEGDSSMVCFVASKSGDAFCTLAEIPSSVPMEHGVRGTASLSVLPNPAVGRTLINVDMPAGAQTSGVNVVLFNERGEQVMDLTESFRASGYRHAEFDASALPSGVYYCRAAGSNWSGVAGVVVEH